MDPELREYFDEQRQGYKESIYELPVAHLRWRLEYRTKLAKEGEAKGDYKLANDIISDASIELMSAKLENIKAIFQYIENGGKASNWFSRTTSDTLVKL